MGGWHFWATLAAGLVAASLIDWLFAGVLFHSRYQRHPEVWRAGGERGAVVIAQLLTIPTVLGVFVLLAQTGAGDALQAGIVAVIVWAIAAAPATIVNGLFVRIDPLVVAAHTAGWLIKLVVVALIWIMLPVVLQWR